MWRRTVKVLKVTMNTLFCWSSSPAWEQVGTRKNTQHSVAKVGNSTRPNKSLYYAQTQCVFVRENPRGDNVAGFSPPTDSGEESRSTVATEEKWEDYEIEFKSKLLCHLRLMDHKREVHVEIPVIVRVNPLKKFQMDAPYVGLYVHLMTLHSWLWDNREK